ncbi:kinase-like domain-containing protein [Tanacetum coccineum]|uniref:Kinase-like domain-containing protein n=1 Tax=Tanacetum coccineum TaxID=301880 RepID=A0ABQ5FQS8_9ASTR
MLCDISVWFFTLNIAPAGRLLVWYVIGVATLRALVHAGDKTSGDARSWYMISRDAKCLINKVVIVALVGGDDDGGVGCRDGGGGEDNGGSMHHTHLHHKLNLINTSNKLHHLSLEAKNQEYGIGSEMTSSGDVYSFGILLLEVMTGKKPTDDMFKNGLSLHKFAYMALPDYLVDVIDNDAIVLQSTEANANKVEECLIATIKIGVSCSLDSPPQRMKIEIVVTELQRILDVLQNIYEVLCLIASLHSEVESNCDKQEQCI